MLFMQTLNFSIIYNIYKFINFNKKISKLINKTKLYMFKIINLDIFIHFNTIYLQLSYTKLFFIFILLILLFY